VTDPRLEPTSRTLLAEMVDQRGHFDGLRQQLDALAAQPPAKEFARELREINRHLAHLKDASVRAHRMLAHALKHADWEEELRVDERRLRKRLSRLRKSTRPVVIGPWSGEVGFELLYWIPFVTWAIGQAEIAPERILVVSRGGPESWYAHLGGRYLDALSFMTPDDFRAHTQEQKKQRRVGPFDRDLVRRAIRAAGLSRPMLLHPGAMYKLFYPFWKQRTTVTRIDRHTQPRLMTRPPVPVLEGRLPSDYVAVRFYFSDSFPETPENRSFVDSTISGLAETTDIVLLNTAFRVDDHRDYSRQGSGRVHVVDDLMTPARNLDLQTAVIAGARAFVGTYGGYAYLAPLCGVPALAFYSVRDTWFAHHLEVAERVFRALGAAPLATLDVRAAGLLQGAIDVPRRAPA
jgi:hypothetical protein